MDNIGTKSYLQKFNTFLPCFVILGMVTMLVGIGFLSTSQATFDTKEVIVDYTDCMMSNIEEDETVSCLEYMKENNDTCVCFQFFNITDDFHGDITFYYELGSFNQLRSDYLNSRDDNQLNGILEQEPSKNCEPYRFDTTSEGNKPIAPCGAIADAMFTDTFRLKYSDTDLGTVVPTQVTGMLSDADKVGFRNPENMSTVIQNFTKPRSWNRNILDLDPDNPDNNGFQNEYFISWMKTEWNRKPWAVLNKTDEKFQMGLQKGQYELRIGYRYPSYLYDGPRKVIITAKQMQSHREWLLCGIIAIVIGVLLLMIGIGLIFWHNQLNKKQAVNQEVARPLRST